MIIRQTTTQIEQWRRRLGDRAGELDRFIVATGDGWVELDRSKRGWRSLFGFPDAPTKVQIHRAVSSVLPDDVYRRPEPLPFDRWPAAILEIARMREPGQRGVGDTVHQAYGVLGQVAHVALAALLIDCQCHQKQLWLNDRFPYEPAFSAP